MVRSEAQSTPDRVGLGWRPEIGLGILEELDGIDVIEILAENCVDLNKKQLGTFRRLSAQIDVVVHAVSLGLASSSPVSRKHLDAVARVIHLIEPEAWSEHLAFVRNSGEELGHLAAPPWTPDIVESTIRNIRIAAGAIGTTPHLENIATLYHPPGSTLSEADWTKAIIKGSGSKLLLDLENVYANSRNFGADWIPEMRRFPLEDVSYVHIAGGHTTSDEDGEFFVDDHLHPVPDEVFDLLEDLAARTPQPLTVILERDGNFPAFDETKAELERARLSLARGRQRLQASRP